MSSGLRQRVVTGLLLAAALVAILVWLPAGVAVGAVLAVVAAGAWEWAGFAGLQSSRARIGYLLTVGLAIAAAWWLSESPGLLRALLWATLAWWLAGFVWVVAAPGRVSRTAAALAGVLVPLALKRFGVDPAVAGGVVVTTVTDVVGFASLLGLGTLLLL